MCCGPRGLLSFSMVVQREVTILPRDVDLIRHAVEEIKSWEEKFNCKIEISDKVGSLCAWCHMYIGFRHEKTRETFQDCTLSCSKRFYDRLSILSSLIFKIVMWNPGPGYADQRQCRKEACFCPHSPCFFQTFERLWECWSGEKHPNHHRHYQRYLQCLLYLEPLPFLTAGSRVNYVHYNSILASFLALTGI